MRIITTLSVFTCFVLALVLYVENNKPVTGLKAALDEAYQIRLTQDSVYLMDGEKMVKSFGFDSELGLVILKDNE